MQTTILNPAFQARGLFKCGGVETTTSSTLLFGAVRRIKSSNGRLSLHVWLPMSNQSARNAIELPRATMLRMIDNRQPHRYQHYQHIPPQPIPRINAAHLARIPMRRIIMAGTLINRHIPHSTISQMAGAAALTTAMTNTTMIRGIPMVR